MKKSELKQIIKEEINEISPELFKRATDISRQRGQDQRTVSMGQTFFNKFKGKSLMGGIIKDIWYSKPSQGQYEEVGIQIEYLYPNTEVVSDSLKYEYYYYDVKRDSWDVNDEITRADARVLSLIAQYINPETKYKSGGEGFRIKGYGMNEELGRYMFFQNLKTIKQMVDELLELDEKMVDSILASGHDWAEDHIATSKDDVEEVHNFFMTKKAPMEIEEKKFPDLTGDDKVTYADILVGRGVKLKKK